MVAMELLTIIGLEFGFPSCQILCYFSRNYITIICETLDTTCSFNILLIVIWFSKF